MMIFHSYVSLPEGTPLKNMSSSVGMMIPNWMENIMFQSTNQLP